MEILFIILILIVVLPFLLLGKGFSNARYTANENQFSQAGVTVNFKTQELIIGSRKFNVNQVTGMRMRNLESGRSGHSRAMRVTLEIDDIHFPTHKIMFLTSSQGEKFMQRLSTALRKAGGPSFS